MDILTTINPSKEKAVFLARRQLSEFVCDAVNLEGINFTLPEVQTLLDNITIGGHKISDQNITVNQGDAWKHLFSLIESDRFSVTKQIACDLHGIAAKEEALKWGQFRDGGVTIAGTDYSPPAANTLNDAWDSMLSDANNITEIYNKAIFIFLQMARNQFFYDVNRRMGRFMMNGIILSAGYPAINLPAKRKTEFNQNMLGFYASNDPSTMTAFMKSCLEPKIIEIMSE